jgi:hypothetical protein
MCLHVSSWALADALAGGEALADALRSNESLRALHVTSNKIGPEGAKSFGELLKTNKTLTQLVMSDNASGSGLNLPLRASLDASWPTPWLQIDDENGLVSVSLLIYLCVRLATDLTNGGALRVLGLQRKVERYRTE